jgi:PAS domain S-box-containing protein
MDERRPARVVAYGVALLATAVSLLVRCPLWPVLEYHAALMTFIPAVVISAYWGGFRPGLLATLLGALAGHYFLTEPCWTFKAVQFHQAVGLALFVLAGATISSLSESLHRVRRRLVAAERQRAGEALRKSEDRWRCLTEALPQLVWTATPDGSADYFSTQWTEYTGVHESDLLGWRWLDVLHPEDREGTRQAWRAAVAGPGTYDVEYRIRGRDGSYRWFKTRGLPMLDSAGDVCKWIGTCTDITTAKQVEEELRQANARLDLAVRGSNVGIFEIDMPNGVYRDGQVHYLNVWEQLGYEPRTPTDHATWRALWHPDDAEGVERAALAYLSGQSKEFEAEYRVRHRDGSYRWVLSRGVVVRDPAGRPVRFAGTRIDITDRRRAEAELRQAKEAAEAANRAKSEFLANVSHEIRTPMNAILGMTELTLDTELTQEQRQYLTTVKDSTDALLNVINDLLDFARIEAGRLELDPADFSLRALLNQTLRALALRAHKKGLELACQMAPDVPDALVGDAGRLRQVLLNLVGNAIKFTEQGEVVVQVSLAAGGLAGAAAGGEGAARPAAAVQLHFSVRDTGIGIPKDKQQQIFHPFEQADNSLCRRYCGTGLGLSIASRLVELMGGRITVESQPGQGSTFRFWANFGLQSSPSGAAPVAVAPPDLRHLRVLVVDDNATNRLILEGWLQEWRTQAITVDDGLTALDALWRGVARGEPYSLALLDARMPGTDGLALAGAIARSPPFAECRVVLLTSEDQPCDRARQRELGIAAIVMKPIQQEELLEAIYRALSRPQPGAGAGADSQIEPLQNAGRLAQRPVRVLVAEDNVFNQQVVQHLLQRRGHTVRVANDGHEALAALKQESFNLLLLDLHMPGLDGFRVIEAIRLGERDTGGHLPVIALTARAMKGERDRCLRAGMDDYLSKPIRAADLLQAIERVTAATPAAGPALIDAPTLLAACGGDGELLATMRGSFDANAPPQLDRARQALEAGDPAALREAAHKLKGLLSAFSAPAGVAAELLEEAGAAGRLDGAAERYAELAGLVEALGPVVAGLTIDRLRHQAQSAPPRLP